jgi:glycosyltransferase involved in cell wall biosynthesis
MRILYLQYGDYAEAFDRFSAGGEETYREQRKSVAHVGSLAETHEVTVASIGDAAHDRQLTPNLWSVRAPYGDVTHDWLVSLFDRVQPDRFLCMTPHREALELARARRIPTLPMFADTFSATGIKSRIRNWRLSRILRSNAFPCVANHSINASRSLIDVLGVSPSKVVPWDRWAMEPSGSAKSAVSDPTKPNLFYAGSVSDAKGVSDILDALVRLKSHGILAHLTIAGTYDADEWPAKTLSRDVQEQTTFLGRIPLTQVRSGMEAADCVLVPTRHDYAEGMPNTLMESLASHTPLIVSDHPAFASRLSNAEDCLICKASEPDDLADAVRRLCNDNALFAHLSQNGPAVQARFAGSMLTWDALQLGFVDDPTGQSGWIAKNAFPNVSGAS